MPDQEQDISEEAKKAFVPEQPAEDSDGED